MAAPKSSSDSTAPIQPTEAASEKLSPSPHPTTEVSDGEWIDPTTLSAEEQMARFEENLKETDWGHQPC